MLDLKLHFRRYFQGFALLLVSLHLCLATIPRCDSLRQVLADSTSTETLSCHKIHKEHDHTGPQLKQDNLCRCELLRYFVSTLPEWGHPGAPSPLSQSASPLKSPYDLSGQEGVRSTPAPPPRVTLV